MVKPRCNLCPWPREMGCINGLIMLFCHSYSILSKYISVHCFYPIIHPWHSFPKLFPAKGQSLNGKQKEPLWFEPLHDCVLIMWLYISRSLAFLQTIIRKSWKKHKTTRWDCVVYHCLVLSRNQMVWCWHSIILSKFKVNWTEYLLFCIIYMLPPPPGWSKLHTAREFNLGNHLTKLHYIVII